MKSKVRGKYYLQLPQCMRIILEPFTAHQKGHKELICPNFTSLCAGVCLSYHFSSTFFFYSLSYYFCLVPGATKPETHTTYTHKKKCIFRSAGSCTQEQSNYCKKQTDGKLMRQMKLQFSKIRRFSLLSCMDLGQHISVTFKLKYNTKL